MDAALEVMREWYNGYRFARGAQAAARLREARAQLRGYLADEALRRRSVRYVGLAVVFHGWEMAVCEAE
ncbi:MAG: hypothetical protein OXG04_07185 [Acidobacteria bacterium]|nr:hypothetical protein [Acidobacteriota bacterium]